MDNHLEEKQYISVKDLNKSNKEIIVKRVLGLDIQKFRNMIGQKIELSQNITLISGHNGTMKSTLIGLFVQSFNSDVKDLFDGELKTKYGQIFKLSTKFDSDKYEYNLLVEDNESNYISIPVYTKPRSSNDPRPRIVTGGNTSSDGNLNFPTNYLNLNRLMSISSTNSAPFEIMLSSKEYEFVSDFYQKILQKDSYQSIESISDKIQKKTFAPNNSNYDFESISSGEDNLGRIVNSLISFMRIHETNTIQNTYNGILCIDEIEASLHPVAQKKILDFLLKWSQKYKVQILITTHSLPLIKYAIEIQQKNKIINTYYLSSLYSENINVIKSPDYQQIYQELTFDYSTDSKTEIPKIDILCEDDLAKRFIKLMISSKHITERINFISFDDTEGFPYNFLVKLCNTASSIVKDTIIIFDSDVQQTAINKIKNQENVLQLPDCSENLPIEKLFVKFIFEKNLDDKIFSEQLSMPKAAVIATFNDSRLNLNKKFNWQNSDVKPFKKWFDNNKFIVNKLFNTFSKNVNGRKIFVDNLLEKMNRINDKNGYPKIIK